MTDFSAAASELIDAICPKCAGVHVSSIEEAVTVFATGNATGGRLPWCTCCEPCKKFQSDLTDVFRSLGMIDPTSHEDAL